jgi:hypothetical protein
MHPIVRSRSSKSVLTVDEVVIADRKWFDEHPDEDSYIREFVPGEFGKAELPDIPDGFRYATHVEVILRVEGQPGGTLSLIDGCA